MTIRSYHWGFDDRLIDSDVVVKFINIHRMFVFFFFVGRRNVKKNMICLNRLHRYSSVVVQINVK